MISILSYLRSAHPKLGQIFRSISTLPLNSNLWFFGFVLGGGGGLRPPWGSLLPCCAVRRVLRGWVPLPPVTCCAAFAPCSACRGTPSPPLETPFSQVAQSAVFCSGEVPSLLPNVARSAVFCISGNSKTGSALFDWVVTPLDPVWGYAC